MRADRRRRRSVADTLGECLRERTAIGRATVAFADDLRTRTVPRHWSNLFGVVTVASIVVLFVTGALLMLVYVPSSEQVSYRGGYAPLTGVEVSRAFDSVMRLSFEVPGGLLLRQLHHWAALLVPASVMAQLLVSFFTGAFRRPRRASWVALFLLLVAVLAGGWSGYALPDDMLSGTGLRIVQGIVLGIPLVGAWIASLMFGGGFPGTIIETLYPIHIAVVPVAVVLLVVIRLRASLRSKPPQFAAGGREEGNVVGQRLLPNGAARAGGLAAAVMGMLALIAATTQVAPVWIYGPADPGSASAGSQPDWYTGFLDGALRLVPPGWEVEVLGQTWTLAVLAPLAVVGVFMLTVAVYPFLEGWIAKDRRDHHILDRPRDAATRTGIGVAGMTFFGVLWLAASADILVVVFSLAFEHVIATLQATLVLGPVVAFVVTRSMCLELQQKDRELVTHGFESGRIVRRPGGEYVEVHQPLDPHERWRIVGREHPRAIPARPDEAGRLTLLERTRAALAHWFFEERVELPVHDEPSHQARVSTKPASPPASTVMAEPPAEPQAETLEPAPSAERPTEQARDEGRAVPTG